MYNIYNMGNAESNCGIENGVYLNDGGVSKCYTSSQTVNVKNFQSVTISKNTSVQAFTGPDGTGTNIPFDNSLQRPIKSVVITVHLSSSAIAGIVIGSIILTFIIAYGMYHGRKYYKKHYGRPAPIRDMGNSYMSDSERFGDNNTEPDPTLYLKYARNNARNNAWNNDIDNFGGGYSKLRLR